MHWNETKYDSDRLLCEITKLIGNQLRDVKFTEENLSLRITLSIIF